MSTSTTTPPGAGTPAPSTEPGPTAPTAPARRPGTSPIKVEGGQLVRVALVTLGETVLVKLDENVRRPMIVTATAEIPIYDRVNATVENPQAAPTTVEFRASGTIFCEPEDHTTPGLRGQGERPNDPARIHGRPDRYHPIVYGEALRPGTGIGEWIKRPSNLPSRS